MIIGASQTDRIEIDTGSRGAVGRSLHVALLTAHLSEHSGGLAGSVPGLARALNNLGDVEATIVGLRDPAAPESWRKWGDRVRLADPLGPRRLGFAPYLAERLRELAPDLVDVQGLWMYHSIASLRHHRNSGTPYVVTPRGMLDPWALANSAWKKRLAWALYEGRNLRGAACLHATSEMEAHHLRRLGLTQPLAIVPNAIDVPYKIASREGGPCRTLLFLSRIHPKKGIDILLCAWRQVQSRHDNWQLVIAGPDEIGWRAQLERMATELGLVRVIFRDGVWGEEKSALYGSADLFVLPTHSENFGLVVAEALAHGVPVITTRHAPWSGLDRHSCGWWIDLTEDDLARALAEAMSLSDEERVRMGRRGREWMKREFTWPSVARQMRDVYAWVVGGGGPPPCVMTD